MGFETMFGGGEADDPSNGPAVQTDAPETPPAADPAPVDPAAPVVAADETPPATDPAPVDPAASAQPHNQLVSALTEERARRREIQEQLNQTNTRFNELLMRMQQAQQPQPQQPQIPAFEDNPAEHLRAIQEQHAREMAELRQQVAGNNQRNQVVDQHTQFVTAVGAHEAEFAARVPDYHAATGYVQQRKLAEYKAVGLNDVEARQALARDTMSVAQIAIQRGQNPAEVMYGLAKTMGFTAPGGTVSAGQPNQTQRPAAPSSLSSAGGSPGADVAGQPSPEAISKMSDAEFDSWWNKMAASGAGRGLQ